MQKKKNKTNTNSMSKLAVNEKCATKYKQNAHTNTIHIVLLPSIDCEHIRLFSDYIRGSESPYKVI